MSRTDKHIGVFHILNIVRQHFFGVFGKCIPYSINHARYIIRASIVELR